MKYLIALIAALFLVGCGGSQEVYLLSVPSSHIPVSHFRLGQIGVDQVHVPDYLSSTKIPKESNPGQVSYCSESIWVSPPETALTEHLMHYLQKRFATPNVYRYPWDIEKGRGVRLRVQISRFIYTDGGVILDANYRIDSFGGKQLASRMFHTIVPVRKGETPLIVDAMNSAYDRLSAEISVVLGRL